MENLFHIEDDILLLKSKEKDVNILDHKDIGKTFDLNPPSKVELVSVEPLFEENFSESDIISKRIIVDKIDDFMEKNDFEGLGVVASSTFHDQDFNCDEGNVTIVVPEDLCGSDKETHIISNRHGYPSHEIYFNEKVENSSTRSIKLSKSTLGGSDKLKLPFKSPSILKKRKSITESEAITNSETITNSEPQSLELEISDPCLKKNDSFDLSSGGYKSNRGGKEKIKIDKNDPRSRLHFIKYMKKDGMTKTIVECGICGKEFFHQYTLMRHLPTHTDERNFKCVVCGKAFKQMSTLLQHKSIHAGARPFVCDVCQKTFARVSALISHKKTHGEKKSHACNVCGKGFHQKVNLKNHFFTHTNERPYKCDICGRGFNQATNVRAHKRKTHFQKGKATPTSQTNRFKCSTCDEVFNRRIQLRRHEQNFHEIKNSVTLKGGQWSNSVTGSKQPNVRKRKMGNIQIIQMPNPDSTHFRKKEEVQSDSFCSTPETGILIDPIDTKAMHKALSQGRTPFALLKPAHSSPVVVQVKLCDGSKHMLVPASASELKCSGEFSITDQKGGHKTVQIKVSVVATVHQRVDNKGEVTMEVEPPSDEIDDRMDEPIVSVCEPASPVHCSLSGSENLDDSYQDSNLVQHFMVDSSQLSTRDSLKVNSETLADQTEDSKEGDWGVLPIELTSSSHDIKYLIPPQNDEQLIEISPTPDASIELIPANIHLKTASQDNISETTSSSLQYLRPTENFGEYEVIEADETTIFSSSDDVVQHLKPLLDTNDSMSVDQSQLTALMNALQTAGYQLHTDEESDNHQIVLNAVDDTIIVPDQHVQMVIGNPEVLESVHVSSITDDPLGLTFQQ